ncbi:MAG: alpha-amylase family protein [Jatrophihabitans sp.]|uniref:alpha-amylase family protein n=1 Tax=Jatrophihabitans sp. TaxID=1932789 RepID=UPI003F8158ED
MAALTDLSPERRELFELRVERWLPDLRSALASLFDDRAAATLETRLLAMAGAAYAERPDDLHRLDQTRILRPDWFQSPHMIGYAAYCDRLAADLPDLHRRLPYLHELGVTYLHLMPLLRPRPGDSDGGYAVADYRSVRPDLGTVDDLRELASALRARGISLVLDLVLNHVAREHAWAQAARAGDPKYRDYFYVYPDRTQPDAYERTLPEVFPDFAPGNFTWDDELGGWVWTTFNSFQWDVNWTNPDVVAEYVDIVLWLANLGVEVIRLDAIAFLWKRLGTNCQNQPEVHAIAQALRAVLRMAAPAVLLKAEAIVAPDDLVQYLGQGRHHGKVSDLAYHNSLMVQIWSMLASRDVRLAAHALGQLPAVPSTTAWICYLRCHDDIGWAIDDGDAAAVGLNGFAHRAFLSDFYSGEFPGSFAEGLVFQANPATGDKRISGMAASLAGLAAAERAGDPDAVTPAVQRLLLAHAIVLGWGGIPVLWMGDEVGLPSDDAWASEPGHESDNRWLHRPRFDDDRAAAATVPGTAAQQLWSGLRHLVATRRSLAPLHAATPAQVLSPDDPGVLPVLRVHPEGELLELFNVTEHWRPWSAHRVHAVGIHHPVDALTGAAVTPDEQGRLWLAPYQAMWLVEG